MSGFVYLWYDRKHKRYYVGSHWGTEDDGYVCSSPWMKQAYVRRPDDFKRRILERVTTNRKDLLISEGRWLAMMKDCELRKRYYNMSSHESNHWTTCEDTRSIKEKISASSKGKIIVTNGVDELRLWPHEDIPEGWVRGHKPRKTPMSEATKQKIREGITGIKRPFKPRGPLSEETKRKIGERNSGRKHPPMPEDVRRRISETLKARSR